MNAERMFMVAVGGSRIEGWENCTSDSDYFVVAPDEESIGALRKTLPESDIEDRTVAWYLDICAALSTFQPTATPALPPFSWQDLRFLARILRGQILSDPASLRARADRVQYNLRLAIAQLYGTIFHNVYQDIYGLYEANCFDECLLMAGDLAQRACLQAVLQTELADPSHKWGARQALQHQNYRLRQAACSLIAIFRQAKQPSFAAWMTDLFGLVRCVVASAILAARTPAHCEAFPASEESTVSKHSTRASLCLVGIPGYSVAMDVVTRDAFAYNSAQLAAWATLPPRKHRRIT